MNWKFWNKEEQRAVPQQQESVPVGALLFDQFRNNWASQNLSTVFRCVDLISDSLAMLPINVQDENKNKINHPLNFINTGNQTKFEFMKMLIQSVLLRGNGFALIERAKDGTPVNLRFVESGEVNIFYDKTKPSSLYYTCNLIPNKRIEPCNIIHLMKYSYDGVNGKSVLSYAERAIKLGQSSENVALEMFTNGCKLTGYIKATNNLSPKQIGEIHESWANAMSQKGLAVMPGNLDYTPIQISNADAQLLESRLFQVSEIARFFGISPILLGDLSHAGYSTLENAQQEFLVHTLQPFIIMIEQEFTRKLVKPSESGLSINLDESYILRSDKAAQANYYSTLLKNGILTPNEIRKELGYVEVEGADKLIIPYTDTQQNTINGEQGV